MGFEPRTYHKYWGKASDQEDRIEYHLLPYHLLDVASVGCVFLKQNAAIRHKLQGLIQWNGGDEEFLSWITFLLALHDVGKFSESFQNLRPDIFSDLHNRTSCRSYNEKHDSLGWFFWRDVIKKKLHEKKLVSQQKGSHRMQSVKSSIDYWIMAMVGHHGVPPKLFNEHSMSSDFDTKDYEAVNQFLEDVIPILLPQNKPFPQNLGLYQNKLASFWLAGLAVFSDWLGSNRQYFPYKKDTIPLAEYWKIAEEQGKKALKEVHILKSKPSKSSLSLTDLIKHTKYDVYQTPMQEFVSKEDFPRSPHFFILEDITGSGKTEAGLLLTHKLMRLGQGNGIYFALPTMATANAMYLRMSDVYSQMFDPQSRPSIILAHTARDMSKDFQKSILPKNSVITNEGYGQDQNLPAEAHCDAWLADNKKKALLADVGVGTIDQALLAILPSRHQSLRLFGLTNKILLVDEVHAYDAYMHTLLCKLLYAHALAGNSVILLSATLPKNKRQELLQSYAKGMKSNLDLDIQVKKEDYPLLTYLSAKTGLKEYPISSQTKNKREIYISFLFEIKDIDNQVDRAVQKGQCVCWIKNTVADAIKAYQHFKKLYPDKVELFHARYALGDRLDIEKNILKRFDKKSTPQERKGRILIATQVVEQSLDLDFDVLISDLAPIDLLIQRTGRLHRHKRDQLGNVIDSEDERSESFFYIHSPKFTKNPDSNWLNGPFKGTEKVYQNIGKLWLTAEVLQQKKKICLPKDLRFLIENVYGDGQDQRVPKALQSKMNEAESKERKNQSYGEYNALPLEKGYTKEDADFWWDELKTPTRLGDPTISVYLAKWKNEKLQPWIDFDIDNLLHAWHLSQVTIRSFWIKDVDNSAIPTEVIKKCKKKRPAKGKYGILLPLVCCDGEWKAWVVGENDKKYEFIYSKELGCYKSKKV